MYRYGDKQMDFLDAVLILKNRGAVEEAERHLAPDIALAIKTVVEGLDDETQKIRNAGYTRGYLAAEKEKESLVEKMLNALVSKEEQMKKVESLLNVHTDFSRETPEVNYELLVAMFRILNLERDEERTNEIEM